MVDPIDTEEALVGVDPVDDVVSTGREPTFQFSPKRKSDYVSVDDQTPEAELATRTIQQR